MKKIIIFLFFCLSITNLFSRSLVEIIDSNKIIIGIRTSNPPFGLPDSTGIDFDLSTIICEKLGVEAEFVLLKGPKFREIVLENDEVDLVISSYSVTPEREIRVSFSVPYYNSGSAFMILADNLNIHSYQDLDGRKITTTIGSTGEQRIRTLLPKAIVLAKTSTDLTYTILNLGLVSAIINDITFLKYQAFISNGRYKVLDGKFGSEDIAIGVNKNYPILLEEINCIIKELRSIQNKDEKSRLRIILEKYGLILTVDEIEKYLSKEEAEKKIRKLENEIEELKKWLE